MHERKKKAQFVIKGCQKGRANNSFNSDLKGTQSVTFESTFHANSS